MTAEGAAPYRPDPRHEALGGDFFDAVAPAAFPEHHLRYSTKSFSLIETGEPLVRGDEPSPTRSGVLVRLSHSPIRFGSFQRQAALDRTRPHGLSEATLSQSRADRAPGAGAAALAGSTRVLPWIALLVAFSPLLPDLWTDFGLGHKHRFIAFLAMLLVVALIRAPRRAGDSSRRPRVGGLGLGLEVIGVAGGTESLARLGLPIAALGMAALLGAPPRRVVFLGVWLVPVPNAVLELTSPEIESALGDLAASALRASGGRVELHGVSLLGASGARLDLRAENSGLLLAHGLAAIGWFLSLRSGLGWWGCARGAGSGYGLGILLAPVALLAAAALVAAGEAGLARSWLGYGALGLTAATWMGCARLRTGRLGGRTGRRTAAPRSIE